MPAARTVVEAAPEIALRQGAMARDDGPGDWRVAWIIENKSARTLEILAARLPHSQFKADEIRFVPALHLAPKERGQFEVCVKCHEPVGLVTENAFVIFSVIWSGEAWRIFVRIRVVVGCDGKPETATELITSHKVGFSGVTS
jgi:hypothetical protein